MNNDFVNGLFETTSGLFGLINIFRLVKDKELKGISWIPTFFFTIWGFWNVYYYPTLHQTFSFIGGIFISSVNIFWLILVFHYRTTTK